MPFSELSNEEWAMVCALIGENDTSQHSEPRRGRPRAHPRTVVNAVLWTLTTGESWSRLPRGYPTAPTCRRRFVQWQADGTLAGMMKTLEAAGRAFVDVPPPRTADAAPMPPQPPAQSPPLAHAPEGDRLRGAFWQNPASWPSADGPASKRSAHPPRTARTDAAPLPFEPVADARGYGIFPMARAVGKGMFRGWAEIVKDGRRVARSGLIGPRFASAETARAYALDWARRWIDAQSACADAGPAICNCFPEARAIG